MLLQVLVLKLYYVRTKAVKDVRRKLRSTVLSQEADDVEEVAGPVVEEVKE